MAKPADVEPDLPQKATAAFTCASGNCRKRGEHHLTLHKLETVITKLKIRLSDIFPGEF
jgi:hypothetical protein